MSSPVAARAGLGSRRALCAAIALALGLICSVIALAAVSAPVTGMTGAASASAAPAGPAAGPAAETGPTIASSCDGICVSETTSTCALVAGVGVATVLALLLASRRDTLVGLLRVRPTDVVRRPRGERAPWTAPSLSSLCVLRV